MSVDLGVNFEQFLAKISLGDPQVPRMDSAARTVSDFLCKSYGLPSDGVFLQGSYPNGTAIEPVAGGEYDVDLIAVCCDGTDGPDAALSELERRFRADGRFANRVKRKNPCVRLEYAGDDVGDFHVDVVPSRRPVLVAAPLEVPRRGGDWKGSAPTQYTAWCQAQGPRYIRTVKMLKRWRAEQQSVRTAIKSIVLQVLIAGAMPQIGGDAARIAATIETLHSQFGLMTAPPTVWNPVLGDENLAASWSQESFESFKAELAEAADWVAQAQRSEDPVEASDIWRELFGDDFPTSTPDELGLVVGDISHAETPAARGWLELPDERYGVSIRATVQRGKRRQARRPYRSDDGVLFAGHRLHFTAHVTAPNHVDVWWQVANTGAHARSEAGLRGEIFRGHDIDGNTLPDQQENWESTAYTGSHVIRAMVVRDRRLLATSEWFRVNVYAKGRAYRL
jgi:hypothetical protein